MNPFTYSYEGLVVGTGSLNKLQSGVYGLTTQIEPNHITLGLDSILNDVTQHLKKFSALKLHYRFVSGPILKRTSEILLNHHFKKLNERVEYRSPLSSLPTDEKSPLLWQTMPDKSDMTLAQYALTLKECGTGDPDWSPDDNAFELLKEYLSDPVLTGSENCVQVAKINNQTAAIVVAQVNSQTGWSRITYMGVHPEFRRKGLGAWVHRHGFQMMREQGGTTYHGGTLTQNTAMRKLFETNKCSEYQKLEEWVLNL